MNDHPEYSAIIAKKYSDLAISNTRRNVSAEYVWIDFERVKTMKLLSKTRNLGDYAGDLPKWTFNIRTEFHNLVKVNAGYLIPIAKFRDPFRPSTENVLALCSTILSTKEPTDVTKNREECEKAMIANLAHECLFEIDQEFNLNYIDNPAKEVTKDLLRKVANSFYNACIFAGLSIKSFSIENQPLNYCTYMIGPCDGLRISDELWMSRYIMQRIVEDFHLTTYFGARREECYSFSTKQMREENKGMHFIELCFEKLRNISKLNFETHKVKSRNMQYLTDLSIPLLTQDAGRGCIVMQPPANSDPYVVTEKIFMSACTT